MLLPLELPDDPDALRREPGPRSHRHIGMQRSFRSLSSLATLAVVVLGACGGGTDVTQSSASCAFIAQFGGGNYEPVGVKKAPEEGEHLGTAVLPACDDTGDGDEPQDEAIEVARLEGVSPEQAILWQGHFDKVLVREGASLPPEVAALMQPPPCDTEELTVQLAGPWLGTIGPGQKTEVDMKPPYRVHMFVEEASEERYERAFITVQVPRYAGEPLTRDDMRESLWEGGTINVDAVCESGAFLARDIDAYPPEH